MAGRTSRARAWYRSLYWRIAAGLVAVLVLMLVSQGLLFVYFTYPQAGSLQSRTPAQLATLAASELSTALAQDPHTDIEQFVRGEYGRALQPVVVAMRDGRTAVSHPSLVPPGVLAMLRRQAARGGLPPAGFGPDARRRLLDRRTDAGRPDGAAEEPDNAPADRTVRPRDGAGTRPRAAGPDPAGPGGPGGRGFGPRRLAEFQPIVVFGETVGVAAVMLVRPPFRLVLQEVGPTMLLAGLAVLGFGGAVMAVVVFGPARRRLLHLQQATETLGRGDFSARAPEEGGDEVAELARSFNRMADELAARARALESADRARRQLLADVSHELMTPLTAMRGYLETLSMAELAIDPATRDRYLGIVGDETLRMEHIVGDLLDLARLEGGSPTVRMTDVQVEALFDRVAARHEREIAQRGIRLVRRVDPAAATMHGDPDRLEQVLQNLTVNALRFTPDGGAVTLAADTDGDRVRLTVRDSGPGIPETHLPLIFDRFYKADAARRATGGSGLGLSIVKAIVERHGGTITAHNDGGAVFVITLPARRD
ncbi:MAG: sensor histidine kinase [Vicinamibacterales bacterium]